MASYLDMLRMEDRSERYSKADAVRALQAMLPVRSKGSIERKLQNVSAILDELGRDWIDGYKPLPHYQSDPAPSDLGVLAQVHRIVNNSRSSKRARLPCADSTTSCD